MFRGKKILVVDDEEKIVEVVKSYLLKEGFLVYEAYDGKNALDLFYKINPSLLILDLMLPDIAGEVLLKKIRETSKVPIILLTAKVEEENIIDGLCIGADDYVTKPFSPRQLIARVYALLRRTYKKEEEKIHCFKMGELCLNEDTRQVLKKGKEISLTPTEYNLLLTLMKEQKKVFTREELLNKVLGDDFEGFDRAIDSHIKNLRGKIEDNSRTPKYIITVHGLGYRFGGK